MSVAAQLHQLDAIDADIERLEAELSDARRRIRQNPALEAAERRLDSLRAREQAAADALRGRERELAELEARIERDQGRMYSGHIVDARELASVEREIAHHRGQRDVCEEQVLALMEEIEGLQAQLVPASREANSLREQWEADRTELTAQVEHTTDVLAGMREERERVAASIDPKALDLYKLARARSGHAVSTLAGNVCGACHVTLPPRDIQHARSGTLVSCPNCARILYAGR